MQNCIFPVRFITLWNLMTIILVQSLGCVQLSVTPWTAAHQASLSLTISCSLLKLMSIESVMPSNHLILCRPLLLLPSIFPRLGSFPMSRLFASDGQSIGVSALTLILPVSIQIWFPLRLTSLISLQTKVFLRVFSSATIWKHQFFGIQPSLWPTSHPYMTTEKNHSFDYMDLCRQSDVSVF